MQDEARTFRFRILRFFLFVLLASFIFAPFAQAQVNVPLTIQESIYPGAPTNGINRSQDPVTIGIPLPDSLGINNISQLGLAGASAGQFRILARWPSGNIKWVLVDTLADVPAGGKNTGIALTGGSGNFGGSNLATDNGGTIAINTGAAQFVIKKANFNLFDQVSINGKTLVSSGTSAGLVLMGPNMTITGTAPTAAPKLSQTPGGLLPQATYFVRVTYETASGETNASAESTLAVGGSNLLQVSSPPTAPNVTGYYVYVSSTQDGENLQTPKPVPIGTTWTEPATGLVAANNSNERFYPKYSGVGAGCGSCTVTYSSANDSSSTAIIEENGPVKTVIKADGSHVDANGHAYMHYTVRMYFYKGKSFAKVTVIMRNADESNTSGDFPSAYKGFASYEARVTPNLGSGKSYNIATDTSSVTGALTGSDNAYLYQGHSTNLETQLGWAGSNCAGLQNFDRCMVSYVHRSDSSPWIYDQEGFQIAHNGVQAQGTNAQFPQGWADLTDSSGAGMEIGVYQLSAYWPKSLQFQNGGTEARVGIWPDQTLFQTGGSQAYYQAWPFYSIHDVYFNFHGAALSSPSSEFLKLQHYLVGRAAPTQYNAAGVFYMPIPDPAEEDNFYKTNKLACCIGDIGLNTSPQSLTIFRSYDWGSPAGPNQFESRWADLLDWFQRGQAGRYLFASHFYRMVAEHGFPRSDGFDWRSHPVNQLNNAGFPEQIVSANGSYGTADWIEASNDHNHWYGMIDYYYSSGDETLKDQILDGVEDRFLNINAKDNDATSGSLYDTRSLGSHFASLARLHNFFLSQGDTTDAQTEVTIAANTLAKQVYPPLNVSGYGTGQICNGVTCSQGVSQTRGVQKSCCSAVTELQDGVKDGRIGQSFHHAVAETGLYEWINEMGTGWSDHYKLLDLTYAMANWAVTESYCTTGNPRTSGVVYWIYLDINNSGTTYYCNGPKGPGSGITGGGLTSWFNWAMVGYYTGNNAAWSQPYLAQLAKVDSQLPFGTTGWIESSSYFVWAGLNQLMHPPTTQWIDVPVTATSLGGGSYALSWTVPTNAKSLRIKYIDGKNIVNWLNFNPSNNTFGIDPTTNWPWFSSNEVANPPAPGVPNSTQVFNVTGLDPAKVWHFALKVLVSGGNNNNNPPVVSITSPTQGAQVSGSVSVTANASSNNGIAGVQFKLDGANLGSEVTKSPYSISWDTTKVNNGSHSLIAVAFDSLGNEGISAAVTVTVNNGQNLPTVSITSPIQGANVSGSTPVSATATSKNGIAGVQFQLDGANLGAEVTTAPYTISWDTTKASNGSHTLTAIAFDKSNNQATSSPVTVTVSNSSNLPTVTITSPASGAQLSGSVPVTANATSNNGIAGVQFKLDGANLGAEVTTAPYTVSWDTTKTSNGSHTLTAVAFDKLNNQGTSSPVTVTVTNSQNQLTVSITAPAQGANVSNSIPVSATATSKNGIAGVQFKLDGANLGVEVINAPYTISWDTTKTGNGLHTLTAVAFDKSNNQATSSPIAVTVSNNRTPLTVSITAPAQGAKVSGLIPVSATATSKLGIAGVQFQLDGANLGVEVLNAPYTLSWDTTKSSNGSHTLTAIAFDKSNNQATSNPVTVTINNGSDLPTVNITSPISGAHLSGSVPVTATVISKLPIVGVQFTLDGANLGVEADKPPYSITWDTTKTSNGSHVLGAIAYDMANKGIATPITVTVNNNSGPLTVNIMSPVSGAQLSGSVPVTANATSNNGIAGVQFKLDGTNLGVEVITAPYTISWDTTKTSNGSHTLTAVAIDKLNNQATSSPVTVTVNNTQNLPTVSITAPAQGANVSGLIPVSANATSKLGIAGVQFQLDGANLGAEVTTAPYTISWDTTKSSDGSHTLTAIVFDKSNNQATSSPVTVTVNNNQNLPTVSITAPAQGATVSGSIPVSATATSKLGIAGVQFQLDGTNLGAEVTTAPYTISWDTTKSGNGSHTLTAIAIDKSNNQATSGPVGVIVSNGINPPTAWQHMPQTGVIHETWPDFKGWDKLNFEAPTGKMLIWGAQNSCGSVFTNSLWAYDVPTNTFVRRTWSGSREMNGVDDRCVKNHVPGSTGSLFTNVTCGPAPCPTPLSHPGDRHPYWTNAYDTKRNRLYQYSGAEDQLNCPGNASGICAYTDLLHYQTNTNVSPAGTGWIQDCDGCAPNIRIETAMVYDPDDDIIILFGGLLAHGDMGADTWQYAASTNTWTQTCGKGVEPCNPGPSPRAGEGLVYAGNHKVIFFGGYTCPCGYGRATPNNDLWIYDTVAHTWSKPTPPQVVPPPNKYPTVTFDTKRNVMWYHTGNPTDANPDWTYDPVKNVWTQQAITGGPVWEMGTVQNSITIVYDPLHDMLIGKGGLVKGTEAFQMYQISLTGLQNNEQKGNLTNNPGIIAGAGVQGASNQPSAGNSGNAAPLVAIALPAAGSKVSGTIMVVAAVPSSTGLAGVQFQLDGLNLGVRVINAPYSVSWNTTKTSNGLHILTAVAFGKSGVQSTSSPVGITVANNSNVNPPSVSITSPRSGTKVTGMVAITATASTSVGVAGVQFEVDGVNVAPEITARPYSTPWDTSKAGNGTHTITAVARDTAGNTSSSSVSVQVSNSVPVASGAKPGTKVAAAIDGATQFRVQANELSGAVAACSACRFESAADLINGQTTEVRLRPGSTSPVAEMIILKQGALDGTVMSVGTNQFVLQMPAGPGPSSVLVLFTPGVTDFDNFPGPTASLQPGQAVAVRGLLFKSGPQGGPTLVSSVVHLRTTSRSNTGSSGVVGEKRR